MASHLYPATVGLFCQVLKVLVRKRAFSAEGLRALLVRVAKTWGGVSDFG